MDSSRVAANNSPGEITVCDFSPAQHTVAIGLRDGRVKLLDSATLEVKDVMNFDTSENVKNAPAVTAVSCRLPGRLVAGYANGMVKEFTRISSAPVGMFSPPAAPAVSMLEVAERDGLMFAAYNRETEGKAEIFAVRQGAKAAVATMVFKGTLQEMRVLERSKVLVCLSKHDNGLVLFDYTTGEQLLSLRVAIPGLTDSVKITSFCLLPVTRQLRQVYLGDTEIASLDQADDSLQGPRGDIIIFGMEDGTILMALMTVGLERGKLEATILPQNVYRTHTSAVSLQPAISANPAVASLFVDPVTDRLLSGDSDGNIAVYEKCVLRVLNPVRARKQEEDAKKKGQGWRGMLGIGGWTPLEESVETIRSPTISPSAARKAPTEVEMVEKKNPEEKSAS